MFKKEDEKDRGRLKAQRPGTPITRPTVKISCNADTSTSCASVVRGGVALEHRIVHPKGT